METAVWLLSAWVPLCAVASACMVVIYGSRSLRIKNEIDDKELQLRATEEQLNDQIEIVSALRRQIEELHQKCVDLHDKWLTASRECERLRELARRESGDRIAAQENLNRMERTWFERDERGRMIEEQIEKLKDAQEKWETEKKRIEDDRDHAISVAREAVIKNRRLTDLIDRVNRQQSSLADAVRDAMKVASAYVQMIEADRLEALENAEDEAARKKDEEDGEVTNGN